MNDIIAAADKDIIAKVFTSTYIEKIFDDVLSCHNKGNPRSERVSKFVGDLKDLGMKFLSMEQSLNMIKESILTIKVYTENACKLDMKSADIIKCCWDRWITHTVSQYELYSDVMIKTWYNIYVKDTYKTLQSKNDVMINRVKHIQSSVKGYVKYADKEYVSTCNRYAIQQLSEYGNLLHMYKMELSYYDMHETMANSLLNEHMAHMQAISMVIYMSNMMMDEHMKLMDKYNTKLELLIDLHQSELAKITTTNRGRRSIHEVIVYNTRCRSLSPKYTVLDEEEDLHTT